MSESRIFDPKHVLGFRIQVPHRGAKLSCLWLGAGFLSAVDPYTARLLCVLGPPPRLLPLEKTGKNPACSFVLQTGLPVPAVLASMLRPTG